MVGDFLSEVRAAIALLEVFDQVRLFEDRELVCENGCTVRVGLQDNEVGGKQTAYTRAHHACDLEQLCMAR